MTHDHAQETPLIAVVGLACRFPGAPNPDAYWRNLCAGVESISRFTIDELEAAGADLDAARDSRYVPARAILEGSSDFDPAFFGYSPREAEIMDPQHRVFLECAWEALENAGYTAETANTRIGVFAGASTNTYLFRNLVNNAQVARSVDGFQIFLGNDKDFIPTRVSYKLNLRGPSVSVTTACSTSLVAVHFACQSLLDFHCDMALAGAVSIHSPEKEGYLFQDGGIHSPDGHCRAFDAQAAGTVGGNGAGLVVLKRLEDALAAGDTIRAIIRGTAINNDGSDKIGYTAPSVEGQSEVIAEAMAVAGVSPDSISYIEAHGTGTALGDPIEIEALTRAFRQATTRRQYCAIGSVKTNFGHLDAAAGMAGLIKTILALEHRAIPPTLHFKTPNPRIGFQQSPFYVNAALTPWQSSSPRRAGVSSFGIGGTNAHIVLEEAPATTPATTGGSQHILPLSARTPTALAAMAHNLAIHLESNPQLALADVAFTLQAGRKAFSHRAAITATTHGEAIRGLRQLPSPTAPVPSRPVAFLFPGQGAQRPHMGAELYRTQPAFRETIDHCARVLAPKLGHDLRDLLYPAATRAAEAEATLQRTEFAQPALFAIEYALSMLLRNLGIHPHAMLGHSLGEYVAACIAGVFSLDDALDLISTRGELMSRLPTGAMLAVPLAENELRPYLTAGLSIAAANGPSRTVASGIPEEIALLHSTLAGQGFEAKLLRTSHAFHSAMMDPILGEFRDAVRRTTRHEPRIPYISNLTGTWISAAEATDPEYWVSHLRHTVRFADGLASLLADAGLVLLETGPGRDLSAMARRMPECSPDRIVLAALPPEGTFLDVLSKLWTSGVSLDWRGLHHGEHRRRVPLPTYPFERQRFYVRPQPAILTEAPSDWLYEPSWIRQSLPSSESSTAPWLLFADSCGLAQALSTRLPEAVIVEAGTSFQQHTATHFTIEPNTPRHYQDLLSALPAIPRNIAHCWSFTRQPGQSLTLGFYSVFHLLRALGEKSAGVRLHLVTNGVHQVTGNEVIDPHKAAILAFVRVAPQEYPDLTCRNIDVELTYPAAFAPTLASELSTTGSTPVVAYRGRYRWVQTVNAISPTTSIQRTARETFLITGGASGLGLEFATHLAKTTQANLVLVSRSSLDTPAAPPLRLPLAAASTHERRIEAELAIRRLDSYPGLTASLNRLCSLQILAFLRERGISTTPGAAIAIDELMRHAGVLPKFEKFVHYFLRALCDDGIARITNGRIEFLTSLPGDWRGLSLELQRQYPGFKPSIALLAHCAEHYGRALSGEIEAISVLFPDGGSGLMLEAGRDTVEHLNGRVYRTLLKQLLAETVAAAAGRKLRILEIGAGNGVLTGELLPVLADANVEYHFTDLGRTFVRSAETRAAEKGLGFMRFQVLDITAPPEQQGLTPESFDFIFGLDVVHATPNIAATVSNLQRYLKPGGSLALLETLRVARWNEMIFGLTEGWWYFEDPQIRLKGTPVLTLDSWCSTLESTGYTDVQAFPAEPARRRDSDSGLIVAHKPVGVARSEKAHRVDELRMLGSEVLALSADVADPHQMDHVLHQTLERYGRLDGIIHCAAIDDQGSIQWKQPLFEEREFAPKIRGTEILARIAERTNPRIFLLCSSLNTLTGGPGQIGYCAANSYLDAFAHARAGHPVTRTVSVNWDRWQGIGMAADFEHWHYQRTGKKLTGGMTLEQGLAIFDRILWSETPSQVIVSKASLRNLREGPGPTALPAAAPTPEPQSTAAPRPGFDAPQGPIESAVAAVFEATLGGGPVGRNDNFAELGGDSLIAIQVVSRLRESLQVELPLRSIFETPTVATLAQAIANRRWAASMPDASGAETTEMEEGVL